MIDFFYVVIYDNILIVHLKDFQYPYYIHYYVVPNKKRDKASLQ